MPWQWRWNPGITCYTGLEYQEVLRKKYGLPDDWKPEPPAPVKIRASDVLDPSPEFLEWMDSHGYLEPEDDNE
jgi:hypothetical protein